MTSDLLVGFCIYASLTFITLILVLIQRRMTYWRRRGISHILPQLIFGNLLGNHKENSLQNLLNETYVKFHSNWEPFCGFHFFMRPTAMVLQLELAKKILTNDNDDFVICAPMGLATQKSPIEMLDKLSQIIVKNNYISRALAKVFMKHKVYDMHDVCRRYCSDMLAALNCGTESNSMQDKNAAFFKLAEQCCHNARAQKWSYVLRQCYPFLAKSLLPTKKTIVPYLKSVESENFITSLEISSSLLTCALYELARNELMQKNLGSEILTILINKHNNVMTSECFAEMSYLTEIITETWRKYPPYSHLLLRVQHHYTTDRAGYDLEKNMLIIIPIEAMQSDVNYFTTPQQFKPEREQKFSFKSTNIASFETWLTAVALVTFVKDYKFSKCHSTPKSLDFLATLPFKTLNSAVNLQVEKR